MVLELQPPCFLPGHEKCHPVPLLESPLSGLTLRAPSALSPLSLLPHLGLSLLDFLPLTVPSLVLPPSLSWGGGVDVPLVFKV